VKTTSNMLPLLLALFLGALSLWLRYAVESVGPAEAARLRHDPDSVVDNFTLTRLNEAGRANYVLDARRMLHYPDDDSTHLEAPRFLKRGEGPAVSVTADRGALTQDGSEANFYGNVLLVREGAGDRGELRVRTASLQVLAEGDRVRTQAQVTITEGRSVISGVGMELDKRTRLFTILSDARGSFEPTGR
jgi:lipopolysaccharide export system protein LptC